MAKVELSTRYEARVFRFGGGIQYDKLKVVSVCKTVAWYKKFSYSMMQAGELVNRISNVMRTIQQEQWV